MLSKNCQPQKKSLLPGGGRLGSQSEIVNPVHKILRKIFEKKNKKILSSVPLDLKRPAISQPEISTRNRAERMQVPNVKIFKINKIF